MSITLRRKWAVFVLRYSYPRLWLSFCTLLTATLVVLQFTRYAHFHFLLVMMVLILMDYERLASVIVGLIKPRLPSLPPKVRLLLRLALFVFVFALVVYGLVFPHSASLTLALKISLALILLPTLCYKAYADYTTFRSSRSGSP